VSLVGSESRRPEILLVKRVTSSEHVVVRMNSFADDDMEPMLYRVRDFCAAHGISPVTCYKLLGHGQGPRITRIGGGTFISAEDAAAWRRKMAEATDQSQVRPRLAYSRRSWISELCALAAMRSPDGPLTTDDE
jgi:hypothetical protein